MTHIASVVSLTRDDYQASKHIRPLLIKNCNILFNHLFGDDMGYYQDPDSGRKEPKSSHSAVLFIPMSNRAVVNEIKTQYVGAVYDADPEFVGEVPTMAHIDAAIIKIGGTKPAKLKTKTINDVEYLAINVSNNSVQQAHVDPVLYVDNVTNIGLPYGAETDAIANAKIRNGTFVSVSVSFSPVGVKCFANIHAIQYVADGDGTMSTSRDSVKIAANLASAFGAPNSDAAIQGAATATPPSGFGTPAPATSAPSGFGAAPATPAPSGFGAPAPATPAPSGFGTVSDDDIPY